MPGVLVELGFIDHPVEGPELHRAKTQAQLASALVEGIEDFLVSRPKTPHRTARASR